MAKLFRLTYDDGTVRYLNVEHVVTVEKDKAGSFFAYTNTGYDSMLYRLQLGSQSTAEEIVRMMGGTPSF